MSKKLKTIIALAFCIIAFVAILIVGIKISAKEKPSANTDEENASVEVSQGLIINEVVSSSRYSLVTEDGSAPDWIELYNGTSSSVSLSGLCLTDDPNNTMKFPLPDISLKSGEYIIILCDGKESSEDNAIHANFRIGSDGDYIGLFSGSREIHSLEIPSLGKDIAYGANSEGKFRYLTYATPGAVNDSLSSENPAFSEIIDTILPSDLAISEYQTDNLTTLMDKDGEHGKWMEIINLGTATINLSDYALSDNIANIGKWSFPELSLEPGECQVVFLSGKNHTEGELHAGFSLSTEDACLVLSKKGLGIVDYISIDHTLPQNCSYGRNPDDGTWAYYPSPTPGLANRTKSFSRLDIAENRYLPET